VQEDMALAVSGHLVATDSDPAASLTWTVPKAGVGLYGTLALSANGTWTYTLNNAAAKVQALVAGQAVTESFTVKATDSNGAFATQVVTLTIGGSADLPVISFLPGQDHGAVQEDVPLKASGTLLGTDADAGSILSWSVLNGGIGSYGNLTVSAAGKWSYALANTSLAVQSLGQGKHATDSFTVQLSDGHGGVATQAVTLDVLGTNDAPVLAAAAGQAAGKVKEDTTQAASGQLTATDVDQGSHLAWSVLGGGVGGYGTMSVDQTGHWSYALANASAQVQALITGQSVKDAFTIQVADGLGGVASKVVTLTVQGLNETAPKAVADSATTLEHQAVTINALANDSGSGLSLFSTSVPVGAGSLTIVAGHLVFDPGAAFDHLAQGAVATVVGSYTLHDLSGASATAAVTIQVTGTNDAPVVDAPLALGATAGTPAATLNLLAGAHDVDDGAVLHIANLTGLGDGMSLAGSTLTLDPSAAFQALAQGEQQVTTLHYDVVDEFGALAAQSAVLTVTGVNDAPTMATPLSAAATSGDAGFSLDLLVGASDPDTSDVLHVAHVLGLTAGLTLSGDVLAVDPNNAAFLALNPGQHALVQLTFDVVDGHGGVVQQTASIDITGAGMAVQGDTTGQVTEDATQPDGTLVAGTPDASGTLLVAGPDPAATWDWAGSASGNYGSFQLDASTGAWTYTLDNGLADSLASGQTVQENFTVSATDQLGDVVTHEVTVSIVGANDAPVASADYTGTLNTVPVIVDVIADGAAFDPDAGDTLSLTQASITNGMGGSVSIVNNQLFYDPGSAFYTLGAGSTTDVQISYTVQDQAGLASTSTVDVTITGQDVTYIPGVQYGPFTVIDPNAATANQAAIAAAVLGAAPQGLFYDTGSLTMTAGTSSAMFYDGSLAPLGIGAGLLITSGTMPSLSNTLGSFGQDNGMAGSAALDAVVNTVFSTVSYDATTISFDFTVTDPTVTGVKFNAVFGTDEYPEWVDQYVDIAVVLVNGTNVALFNNDPGAPLSVIGSNLAASYFIDNTANLDPATATAMPGVASTLPIEYDGVSHLLAISAPVHLGVNTITIAIADTGDHVYDSGLFISGLTGTSVPGGGVSLPVTGSDSADTLVGGAASETVDAKAGNDSIDAGGGNDTILAGAGDDSIAGGAGNDFIDGGTGANTATFTGSAADYHIALQGDGSYMVEDLRNGSPDGADHLANIQSLKFADGSYAITTWATTPPPPGSGHVINGTAGNDVFSATHVPVGQPALADGGDTINGAAGDDIVKAGAGADLISGGDGNDQLSGGGGDDTLVGGSGHDELTGGSGADVFRFNLVSDSGTAGGAMDQILDFSHADADRIDFSHMAASNAGAHILLVFEAGASSFGGTAGELISVKGSDGFTLEADLNGDGLADFAISVTTATKLIATDFLL
jgi:VCBS repeat-containing protein